MLLLEAWILQLIEDGVDVLSRDPKRIEDISVRLVDHGIPGISKRIRTIPDKIQYSSDWKESVLLEVGELFLYIQLLKNKEYNHLEELKRYLSTPMRRTEVEGHNLFLEDDWCYLGCTSSEEEKVIAYRHWFVGKNTGKKVLFIEYIFNRFEGKRKFLEGKHYYGRIFFYPSIVPRRVTNIPESIKPFSTIQKLPLDSIKSFLDQWSHTLSQIPWFRNDLLLIKNYRIQYIETDWYLTDSGEEGIKLSADPQAIPQLVSLSLDPSAVLAAEYDSFSLRPLSVISDRGVLMFHSI